MSSQVLSEFSVGFFDYFTASTSLITSSDQKNPDKFEALLFCLFIMRQIINLNPNEESGVKLLLRFQYCKNVCDVTWMSVPPPPGLTQSSVSATGLYLIDISKINLISKDPSTAEKSFRCAISSIIDRYNFNFTPSGFGFLGKGVKYYAPLSTLLFVKTILQKHNNDEAFLKKLTTAINNCSKLLSEGKINMANQNQITSLVVQSVWE